jgi:hypothetical protein
MSVLKQHVNTIRFVVLFKKHQFGRLMVESMKSLYLGKRKNPKSFFGKKAAMKVDLKSQILKRP